MDHTDKLDRSDQAAQFARQISGPWDEIERLQVGVEQVVEVLQACDHAGVTIVSRNEVHTDAATSDVVWRGDRLQYELNEGPCVDSVATHGTVVSNDIDSDRRWPQWGPTVARQLGVGSMLSVLLYTGRGEIGALNIYANATDAFALEDLGVAESLAAHLAVAVAASREIAQLSTAVSTRTIIGQAEGMLMERYHLTADQAFNVLRRISQDTNRKLNALATELVEKGDLAALHTEPRSAGRSGGPR